MKQLIVCAATVLTVLGPVAGNAGDEAVFNRLDGDKNGQISRDELIKSDLVVVKDAKGQHHVVHRDMVKQGDAAALTEAQKQRLFGTIDTDKSGHISRKEWNRASPNGFILWKF